MRFLEISQPRMVKLHYFAVDIEQSARDFGLKQDRNYRWYLPQYNTSGSNFDRAMTSAIRVFGRPRTVTLS